jgi:uncharacterized C2H2 Zn-finger protein
LCALLWLNMYTVYELVENKALDLIWLFSSFVDPDPYFFNCTQDFLEAYIVKWRFSTTWALRATFLVYCQKITKMWTVYNKTVFLISRSIRIWKDKKSHHNHQNTQHGPKFNRKIEILVHFQAKIRTLKCKNMDFMPCT